MNSDDAQLLWTLSAPAWDNVLFQLAEILSICRYQVTISVDRAFFNELAGGIVSTSFIHVSVNGVTAATKWLTDYVVGPVGQGVRIKYVVVGNEPDWLGGWAANEVFDYFFSSAETKSIVVYIFHFYRYWINLIITRHLSTKQQHNQTNFVGPLDIVCSYFICLFLVSNKLSVLISALQKWPNYDSSDEKFELSGSGPQLDRLGVPHHTSPL